MSKIDKELLGWVRYPDEQSAGFDDRIPYDDMAEGLRLQTAYPREEIREMAVDTLAELERRWADRQKAAFRTAGKSTITVTRGRATTRSLQKEVHPGHERT
jgi:hypothetical protein